MLSLMSASHICERLGVGVGRDELDAAQAGVDHAVDRVGAAAADADDLDDREIAAAASMIEFRPTLELALRVLALRPPVGPHAR